MSRTPLSTARHSRASVLLAFLLPLPQVVPSGEVPRTIHVPALEEPASSSPISVDVARVGSLVEAKVLEVMTNGQIPSCTVALVGDGRILWSGAFGHANLWSRTAAHLDSVYLIGSTFKTMSTAALLQQKEQGKFELDQPVRELLQGLVIRDESLESPVTFRQLLTHTSGLPPDFGPHEVWGDTVPAPLEDYLRSSLRVVSPPLEETRYSNMAYTLIAHLVEQMSGEDFREYIQRHVFEPCGMHSTVFHLTPLLEERLATPYVPADPAATGKEGRSQLPTARLKADVWPAGIVYGTVGDQARWLLTVLGEGQAPTGQRILESETVRQTLERQYDRFAGPMHAGWGNETAGYGLTWWTSRKDGDRHFAHSGSVPGYTAFLEGNAEEGLGIAILTNGNRAHPYLVDLADQALRWLKESRITAGR